MSALDVSVRAQVLNLLDELVHRLSLTLVFVSHDLSVVRHVCDTVAVMNRGEIVEMGPTDQVYDRPVHPYARQLVAAAPRLQAALAGRTAAVLAAETLAARTVSSDLVGSPNPLARPEAPGLATTTAPRDSSTPTPASTPDPTPTPTPSPASAPDPTPASGPAPKDAP